MKPAVVVLKIFDIIKEDLQPGQRDLPVSALTRPMTGGK